MRSSGRIRMDAKSGSAVGRAARALLTSVLLATGLAWVDEPAMAGSAVETAREELRLRERTERRMREEFESLLANGRMSAEEIADFEIYLTHLAMLVEEQRREVAALEGGAEGASPAAELPGDFGRGQTDAEKIALLDAELGGSLSEFDEKLLREQREIAEKSRSPEGDGDDSEGGGESGTSGQSGSDSADGEGRAGDEQADGGESAAGQSGEGGEGGDRSGAREARTSDGEPGEGDDQVASAGGESTAGREIAQTSTPPDIPDGADDDIVARQLREAAENEQDPELREKLWEEYRKYKKGTR